jgi:hypothetical protein
LQGDRVLLLGKLYHFVDYAIRFDVVKDVALERGDCVPLGNGSKCFELSSVGDTFAGDIRRASFQILKPSGNYYGASFPVSASPLTAATYEIAKGTQNPAGSLLPGEPTHWERTYYGSNVATVGQSYVVVDEVSADKVHLVDAGTGAIDWLWLTETEPVESILGPGDTMRLGKYQLRVAEVDTKKKTADVRIFEGTKLVAGKTLGPVTKDLYDYLPEDPLARAKLSLAYDDSLYVHLDVFRAPFPNGQVALVGYVDLMKLENAERWTPDPRFVVRPDT